LINLPLLLLLLLLLLLILNYECRPYAIFVIRLLLSLCYSKLFPSQFSI